MTVKNITQERLKELLYYDPLTGIFTWLVWRPNGVRVGDVAGCERKDGYVLIQVCGVLYLAHRLAWLYMKGVWPDDQIDHRDTVRNNNQWKNLRPATHVFNAQNRRKANTNNKTGFLGVIQVGERFMARIRVGKKQNYIGTYDTPKLAYKAQVSAKRELHPGCTI